MYRQRLYALRIQNHAERIHDSLSVWSTAICAFPDTRALVEDLVQRGEDASIRWRGGDGRLIDLLWRPPEEIGMLFDDFMRVMESAVAAGENRVDVGKGGGACAAIVVITG